MAKRIRFQGEEYWLVNSDYSDGNICPLDHYSEDGELLANLHDVSFAIIEGKDVIRFHEKIGTVDEIEFL